MEVLCWQLLLFLVILKMLLRALVSESRVVNGSTSL